MGRMLLRIALAAALLVPTARADAAGRVSYYGLTAKNGPVMIETSADGREITRAFGAVEMKCSQGGSDYFVDRWTRLVVSLQRSFTASYSDTYAEGRGDFTTEFDGRFDRRRTVVSGTWRVRFVDHFLDGTVDDCDSGALRFRARRMR